MKVLVTCITPRARPLWVLIMRQPRSPGLTPCWPTASAIAEHRGPDLGEMVPDVLRDLEISLRGGGARIALVAQDRMQALFGQVVEHQVDNAPRVVRLGLRFTRSVHGVPP